MRRAAKIDANQPAIVAALRKMGASVQSLAAVGSGCADLLVGWHGRNLLMEVKDGRRAKSERRLTDDQLAWHQEWAGRVVVVETVEEAIARLVSA